MSKGNGYEDIKEFIGSFTNLDINGEYYPQLGIEFMFNDVWYRIGRDPWIDDSYKLYIMSWVDPNRGFDVLNLSQKQIAKFPTMEDLLKSTIIDGITIEKILTHPEVEILSLD